MNCEEVGQTWYLLSSMWCYAGPGYCLIIVVSDTSISFLTFWQAVQEYQWLKPVLDFYLILFYLEINLNCYQSQAEQYLYPRYDWVTMSGCNIQGKLSWGVTENKMLSRTSRYIYSFLQLGFVMPWIYITIFPSKLCVSVAGIVK